MANAHRLKVWALNLFVSDVDGYGQRRCVVAAMSGREAQRLFGCSQSTFRMRAAIADRSVERLVALAAPGKMFALADRLVDLPGGPMPEDYRPLSVDQNGRRIVTQPERQP